MQPSSLVFVVVIAIWAAYLVQYWVRRREHMSTARSVDRFSRAMRVLDRRSSSAQPDAEATPAARPALVARPRAGQSASQRSGSEPAGMPALPRAQRPRRGPRRLVRLLRAAGLLLAVAAVPATVGLAVLGLAPRWTTAVALSAVVLCLVTLRLAAVREQTARHTERSMRTRGSRTDAAGGPLAQASGSGPDQAVDHDGEQPDGEPAQPAAPPAYRPGDTTWRPVPVPRPTYQLKDPAPPARPEAAASPPPQISESEQPKAPVVPARRAVGG